MDSFNDVWKEVLARCKENVSEVIYNMWFAPLKYIKFENYTVIFSINAEFRKDIIMDKYSPMIRENFEAILGFPIDIDILVEKDFSGPQTVTGIAPAADTASQVSDKTAAAAEKNEEKSKTDSFTFDSFIVGKSNSFAYNTSLSVAREPGKKYNPLLIYGNSGLGKTHLMFAIYNALKKQNPNAIIIYTPAENFLNELLECIRNHNTDYFHNKYRNADALLVDDIQHIQNGNAVQEEFFHTFNVLQQANKQIVMTADVPPREMLGFDERLRTRFEMGMLADIQPPDIETRMAIIKRKCEHMNFHLKEVAVEYIANKIKNNIRQIEGILNKIQAKSEVLKRDLTIEEIQMTVLDFTTEYQPVGVTVDKVLDIVSSTFGVPVNDLKSEKRQANIAQARQVSMYVIKEVTELTLQEIGDVFGKKHSTVLHSIDACKEKMNDDPKFKNNVNNIIRDIRENK